MEAIELNLDKNTRNKITKLIKQIPKTAKTEKFYIIKEPTLLKAEKGIKIYNLINKNRKILGKKE